MEDRSASNQREKYPVRCHCGAVRGIFSCDSQSVTAVECNCSDCFMRQNTHLIVPASDFALDMDVPLDSATILYQWGTKTAIRRFCKVCGILPWYHPRSNPDGVAVTIHCVDWTKGDTVSAPVIELMKFDGQHWQKSMDANREKMSEMSKPKL